MDIFADKAPGENRYQTERAEDIRLLLERAEFRRFAAKLVTELGLLSALSSNRDLERRQVALELFGDFKQNKLFRDLLMETIQ